MAHVLGVALPVCSLQFLCMGDCKGHLGNDKCRGSVRGLGRGRIFCSFSRIHFCCASNWNCIASSLQISRSFSFSSSFHIHPCCFTPDYMCKKYTGRLDSVHTYVYKPCATVPWRASTIGEIELCQHVMAQHSAVHTGAYNRANLGQMSSVNTV